MIRIWILDQCSSLLGFISSTHPHTSVLMQLVDG